MADQLRPWYGYADGGDVIDPLEADPRLAAWKRQLEQGANPPKIDNNTFTRGFLTEEELKPTDSIVTNVLRMFSPVRMANALVPFGHDAQGNYSWSMPSIVADPAESWKGMVDRHRAGIDDPEADVRDSFTVASSAGMGGLAGVGMKPTGAVGTMGGRLMPKELPMDLPSRMARAKEMGFDTDKVWYHGANRIDRLLEKGGLDPKRATSGPMPYFTDRPEIASNYAKGKADTSIYDEGDVAKYFTISPKDLGWTRNRTPLTVEQSWHFLKPEEQATILNRAKRVGYENPDTATGPYTLHDYEATLSPNHFDYLMKTEARGNPLSALREMWYNGGNLVGSEPEMADIWKLAGYPHNISQKTAPWTEAQGVLPTYMRMKNPLITNNTSELVDKVIPSLEQTFKKDRSRLKPFGSDNWDKETRYTPKSWVQQLKDDVSKGDNSYVWTSIPDKVTTELKKLGYDGILDTGNKGGGNLSHSVAIPFSPNQLRSVNAAFDPAKKESANLLAANAKSSAAIPLALSGLERGTDLPSLRKLNQTPFYGEDVGPKGRISDPLSQVERLQLRGGLPEAPTKGFFNPASSALLQEGVQPKQTVTYFKKQLGSRGGKLPPGQWEEITKGLGPDDVVDRDWLVKKIDERSPEFDNKYYTKDYTDFTEDGTDLFNYEPEQIGDLTKRTFEDKASDLKFDVIGNPEKGYKVVGPDNKEIKIEQGTFDLSDDYQAKMGIEQWIHSSGIKNPIKQNPANKNFVGEPRHEKWKTKGPSRNYTEGVVGYSDKSRSDYLNPKNGLTQIERFTDDTHYDHPNLEGWHRTNDLGAGRILEEVQPQRYQKVRDEGAYVPSQELLNLRKKLAQAEEDLLQYEKDTWGDKRTTIWSSDKDKDYDWRKLFFEKKQVQKELDRLEKRKKGIPVSPYTHDVNASTDLILRNALLDAAKENRNFLAWTHGEAQASRYDKILNDVREISYTKDGRLVVANDEKNILYDDKVKEKDLPSIIGKDAANKLLSEEPYPDGSRAFFFPQGMTIGGEGMKTYYGSGPHGEGGILTDRILSNIKRVSGEKPIVTPKKIKGDVYYPSVPLSKQFTNKLKKIGFPIYQDGGVVHDIDEFPRIKDLKSR